MAKQTFDTMFATLAKPDLEEFLKDLDFVFEFNDAMNERFKEQPVTGYGSYRNLRSEFETADNLRREIAKRFNQKYGSVDIHFYGFGFTRLREDQFYAGSRDSWQGLKDRWTWGDALTHNVSDHAVIEARLSRLTYQQFMDQVASTIPDWTKFSDAYSNRDIPRTDQGRLSSLLVTLQGGVDSTLLLEDESRILLVARKLGESNSLWIYDVGKQRDPVNLGLPEKIFTYYALRNGYDKSAPAVRMTVEKANLGL